MRNELDISLEKRYVKEEAFKEGLAEGEAKGKVEGSNARSEEIARKMQAAGMDSDLIKQMTGVEL